MTWHILCIAGKKDRFTPALSDGEHLINVPFGVPTHPETVSSNIADRLAEFGLSPKEAAFDFLNAATAAYVADLRVPRERAFGSYDNWTRQFVLHLPVRNLALWEKGKPYLEEMLRFLTGDHWTVKLRQAHHEYALEQVKEPKVVVNIEADVACLFSGGLDSYIGAIDQITDNGKVVLIGHHGAGGGATSRSQKEALARLRTIYSEENVPFLQFWVSPPSIASSGRKRTYKITTRSRSIMFLGLGVAVVTSMGAKRLVVPENGFISLNVPLTNSRLGSFSTRTTHPYLMDTLRQLLHCLGLDLEIELPYRFQTKGEMVNGCKNPKLLQAGLASTVSCSHPSVARFAGLDPNRQCGYCLPCIIRRAAIASTGQDPSQYVYDDLSQPLSRGRSSDIRALKMALARYHQREPQLKDVLVSGPLPGPESDLLEYLKVFRNGLKEVENFINRY